VSNVSVYSFADATGLIQYVDSDGDFYSNGTWSSTGTYTASPLNAVTYGVAQYMCIRDNIGDNPQRVPTRTRPQSWTILSLLYEYQASGSTASVADDAWNLAQIGTNTGSAAYDLAGSAYALAGSALGILSTGLSGTYSFWVGDTAGAPTNVNITFVNGILVSAV